MFKTLSISATKHNQAQADLTSAKDTQTQDKAKLAQAKDGLAQLNQVLATKQSALDNAKQNANAQANQTVKDKQAKLDKINGKIADLNKAIEATKATIQNAQAQLDADNKKIADIKNGQKPVDPNKGKDDKPTNPSKDGGSQSTKPDDGSQPATPTIPTTPAKPDTGNASISGQAGHKPATSDNGSQATDSNATNKPTIVLPTDGSQSAATQGQYINVISKDSVASQAGIQAPATPETTSVTFGTQEGTLMTREQYKAQQANLPQTGNDKSDKTVAVAGLGILAATTFTTMFGVAKKRH